MSLFNADDLTEEVVAQFLSDHPDFFTHRQDLVERLSLPVNQEGAVSLVEIQLKRQRERINQLEEQITELMTIAASNGQHFHQFMDLQETILKCHSLRQVISAIEKLANSLSLTVYIKLLDCSKVKYHLDRGNWQRFSTNHLNGKSAYLGRLKKADRDLLFEQNICPELGSFAVLPLVKSSPIGALIFASEDGGHFQPSMDTLFLRHLAIILSYLVSTLEWDEESANVYNHTSA